MKTSDPNQAHRIHLIGVGGIGVSGLAVILRKSGKEISGSDSAPSPLFRKLRRLGITVFQNQSADHITPKIDLVIYSQAIPADNPEYQAALAREIPLLNYPEALGRLMETKRGVAVAGTHGKTTTSALTVTLLQKAGLAPSYVIGGEIIGQGNSGAGTGAFLVVEACEYKKSFLNYHPEVAVITNIEEDHLDYYRNLDEIKSAFREFAGHVANQGFLVVWAEDPNMVEVVRNLGRKVITYGIKQGTWQARNISYQSGCTLFECQWNNRKTGDFRVRLNGYHNVLNSLAVLAVGSELGISRKTMESALEGFPGVRRRCEVRGTVQGITVLDDYGHHPTEIKATLASLRPRYPASRLIVVFQPHQYSRTRFLLKDFAESFSLADKVVVPDIYFVRDSQLEKQYVNAELLVERIRSHGKEALYLPTFREIVVYLKEIVRPGDVVLTIGAGPVYQVAEGLLRSLKRSAK